MNFQALRSLPVPWFLGMPCSGKSTLAQAVSEALTETGRTAIRLDGDDLRLGLCKDLGFSDRDRAENIRRAAEMARILSRNGVVAVCSFVTPREYHRNIVREVLGSEVMFFHLECSQEVCLKRDVRNVYQKSPAVRAGPPGQESQFEKPVSVHATFDTHACTLRECLGKVLQMMGVSAAPQL